MPASSPNEIFADFFNQLPTGLLVTVCGSALLLFFAFAWFAYFKPRRARMKLNAASGQMGGGAMMPGGMTFDDSADLPDLDSLINPAYEEVVAGPHVSSSVMQGGANGMPLRRQGQYRVKLNSGALVEAEEIVAVLRDPRDGRLIVQIDETAYRTLAETPDVKKNFLKIMQELSTVVNEPDDNPPHAASDAAEPVAPAPQAAPQPVPRPAVDLPADASGVMPGDLPRYDLDEGVQVSGRGLFGGAKYEPTPVPEFNIAASIEAYLQHRLKFVPEYAGRQIHVHSAPGGGVRIQVDGTFYEAVGDVQQPDVREFLQTTIEEWQQRQ